MCADDDSRTRKVATDARERSRRKADAREPATSKREQNVPHVSRNYRNATNRDPDAAMAARRTRDSRSVSPTANQRGGVTFYFRLEPPSFRCRCPGLLIPASRAERLSSTVSLAVTRIYIYNTRLCNRARGRIIDRAMAAQREPIRFTVSLGEFSRNCASFLPEYYPSCAAFSQLR